MPPLDLFTAFESAAKHLSFTKAGAELFVTQSAVSRQIKTLEDELGDRAERGIATEDHHRGTARGGLVERLAHPLTWGPDASGDPDLAVDSSGLRLRSSTSRAHQLLLLPCLLEVLHVRVQPVEALVPEPLEPAGPLVDRSQPAEQDDGGDAFTVFWLKA